MHYLIKKIPVASYCAFALLLIAMGVVSLHMSSAAMFVVTLLMFITCGLSAMHLFGLRLATLFIGYSVLIGFVAEYMGSNYDWFFGAYQFTDALGLSLFGVPVVIPLMWFNLTYLGFILGNIILHRAPLLTTKSWPTLLSASFFSALLVTAYDLGADPYMVFVVKAWTMDKTDGWWFGETLQGFVGWMLISFVIVLCLNLLTKLSTPQPSCAFKKHHALIPISIYANLMAFQILFGHPVETRTIAVFAMGLPLTIALLSFRDWKWDDMTGIN